MRFAVTELLRQARTIDDLDLDAYGAAINDITIHGSVSSVQEALLALREYVEEFDRLSLRTHPGAAAFGAPAFGAFYDKAKGFRGDFVRQTLGQVMSSVEKWAADPSEPEREGYQRLLPLIRACHSDPNRILTIEGFDELSSPPDSVGVPPTGDCDVIPEEREVLRAIKRSLHGLVGLDQFAAMLAIDVAEFLSGPCQSRGRVIWGNPGVGKTEIAQRLAGLRDGFPALKIGTGELVYISGVDGKLDIKERIDAIKPFSLLFIDEADKCLDPKTGMVSQAEATQLCHAIVTHFQRKPVLWIFLGVFSAMRGNGAITDEVVRATFGDELAHRLDYADWGLPAWSLTNLLKALNASSARRRVEFDDDAVELLANYCIRTGGGVRGFENLETAIARRFRMDGRSESRVTLQVARDTLTQRGVANLD
jgi:hypothetical protein